MSESSLGTLSSLDPNTIQAKKKLNRQLGEVLGFALPLNLPVALQTSETAALQKEKR